MCFLSMLYFSKNDRNVSFLVLLFFYKDDTNSDFDKTLHFFYNRFLQKGCKCYFLTKK